MKNFYEIDSQIVETEGELKKIQAKFEGIVWVKYIAIAVGMGIAGLLILFIPVTLILLAIDWLVGLFGGYLPKGPGTVIGWILGTVTWVGFLGGVALAIRWGIAGGNELEQRRSQLHRFMEELKMQRNEYLRSSTD